MEITNEYEDKKFDLKEVEKSLKDMNDNRKTRKPIVYDLDDGEDVTMTSAPSDKPKKFTKHIYIGSLRKFSRSSLLELFDEGEKETRNNVMRKLEYLEEKEQSKVRKFPEHYSGRVEKAKQRMNGFYFVEKDKNSKSYSIEVNEFGERQVSTFDFGYQPGDSY